MPNISIIVATLTTFTTMGQTENEKIGSDMSISSEVPDEILQFSSEKKDFLCGTIKAANESFKDHKLNTPKQ